jgi:predicted outer membrane protein
MRRTLSSCAVGTLTALVVASTTFAQTPETGAADSPTRQTAAVELPAPPAPQVHLNLIDQKLALSLAVDMQAGIVAGELALKSLTSDSMRQLTSARLDDQRAFAERLDTLTAGKARQALEDAIREIEEDKTASKPRAISFRPAALQKYATSLLVRVRLEILQETDALMWGDLAGKSGAEFERRYLQNEVLRQVTLLSTLKVFESQASPDFAQVIHQAWTMTKQHCDQARALLVQLETAPLADTVVPVASPLTETGVR